MQQSSLWEPSQPTESWHNVFGVLSHWVLEQFVMQWKVTETLSYRHDVVALSLPFIPSACTWTFQLLHPREGELLILWMKFYGNHVAMFTSGAGCCNYKAVTGQFTFTGCLHSLREISELKPDSPSLCLSVWCLHGVWLWARVEG